MEGRSAAVNVICLRCPGFAADNEDFSCMKKQGFGLLLIQVKITGGKKNHIPKISSFLTFSVITNSW